MWQIMEKESLNQPSVDSDFTDLLSNSHYIHLIFGYALDHPIFLPYSVLIRSDELVYPDLRAALLLPIVMDIFLSYLFVERVL